MRAWRRGQYGPPYPEGGEKDKCRRCGGAVPSGEGPADTPEGSFGRAKDEEAEAPSPCDSGRNEVVVFPEAEPAEIGSPPIIGTCVLEERPHDSGKREAAAEAPELEPPCARREDVEPLSPRESDAVDAPPSPARCWIRCHAPGGVPLV